MPRRASRPLTSGEIAISRSVFGDAIDYEPVRMIRGKWWPFQPRGIVMAPTGHIHFHPDDPNWREDFSDAVLSLQGLFIHEMTHVWQAQVRGRFYLPLMRHPFCRYAYRFEPGKPFHAYGLEQQAEIVRHAFLLKRGAQLANVADPGILPFASA
ncbi:vgr related protein [Sphingomonas arenae]|uniref:vgr related protein n=1 Tax=Sphingomonas arenae TaxID=2812555 RepID=UPI00196881B3|nr:vgr related protein [Sphingomonas arenae]